MQKEKLPSKENALFRSIVKHYETKQYKKGLKASDNVLKKFPEHGETWAMRGLTLNCMNRKDEAYDNVRKGLKYDLRSHVCWHVYGLLYRSDNNYHEAIKCYQNALRIDQDNLQILRDLYLLQIQIRDLKGYAETRRTLLQIKSNNRNNWIGFAISHHLSGNHDMAVDILDKFMTTIVDDGGYEQSEMLLYRNQILEESNQHERALELLERDSKLIKDQMFVKEKHAEYGLKLGRAQESLGQYQALLEINPANLVYHEGYQASALLAESDTELAQATLVAFYDAQARAQPKEILWTRLPLEFSFLSREAFESRLTRYIQHQCRRGVPSLGSDLAFVYRSSSENLHRTSILEDIIVSSLKSLETQACFRPLQEDTATKSDEHIQKEPPMTLLWTTYLAAQHYDRMGDHAKALEYIDACIAHTPTIVDFYQRKGRILKHMGDIQAAANVMVQGRKIDLADRYINNKATEYLLRAHRNKDADDTIALFTRHEGQPRHNLFDMQCMWYEVSAGQSYLGQRRYAQALKNFSAVEKHFNDIWEDQFDFHSYCLRKMTIRAYFQMLRLTDELYAQPFFRAAALGMIQCYLALHDAKVVSANSCSGQPNNGSTTTSSSSAAEKKKLKRAQAKARKAEFKQKQGAMISAQAEGDKKQSDTKAKSPAQQHSKAAMAHFDCDPEGLELAKADALVESWRLIQILQKYAAKDLETHVLAFDVALRKTKWLLCIQAIRRMMMMMMAKSNIVNVSGRAQVEIRVILLSQKITRHENPIVQELLVESVQRTFVSGRENHHHDSIETYVETYVERMKSCGEYLSIGAPVFLSLDADKYGPILQPMFLAWCSRRHLKVSTCVQNHELIQRYYAKDFIQEHAAECQHRFPSCPVFQV